ncbi:MAG: HlyD family efflux transporter periplasmic adaptor subunit [Gemmatimonadota bacterium]|nr:MAG: HlyD family efflux transporter periplasmic adaptor subunit [Gemmatimonadota bacterium]
MDRILEKKKWPPKKIAGISFVVFFCGAIIYGFFLADRSSKLNIDAEKITIAEVTRDQFQESIPVIGNVLPIKTVYLDAVEGGRVETRFVEAGTLVQEGDKILKLSNTNLLLDIMYREAQLFEQSNNLRNSRLLMEQNRLALRRELAEINYNIKSQKRLFERRAQLAEKKLISQEEYEQAKDDYEFLIKKRDLTIETQKQDSLFRQMQITQLEASLERMESNLVIAKQKLDNLIINAPVTGALTSLNAEIGESKAAGERLGQIDVLEGFKVRAAIDEHYLHRIEIGRSGTFDFAGNSYRLTINKIYPEVQEGRFEVDMEFMGAEPVGIRRGQTLHIRLDLGDLSEAILIPRGGFYQSTGGQWVYVLSESGAYATKRATKLGRQNPEKYEVLEGLKPGEQVITSSYDTFGDFDKLILK